MSVAYNVDFISVVRKGLPSGFTTWGNIGSSSGAPTSGLVEDGVYSYVDKGGATSAATINSEIAEFKNASLSLPPNLWIQKVEVHIKTATFVDTGGTLSGTWKTRLFANSAQVGSEATFLATLSDTYASPNWHTMLIADNTPDKVLLATDMLSSLSNWWVEVEATFSFDGTHNIALYFDKVYVTFTGVLRPRSAQIIKCF
jgi:hypothetical protein